MVSSKRADYVVRLLAKELIMLLACFLYFILKVLDSTIFALIKQVNLHEPTRVVGMAKILSETFVLFIPLSSLAFQILFFFRKLSFKPTHMGKESTKSHLQMYIQSFALGSISLSGFCIVYFPLCCFFVVNPPVAVLETNFRLSETFTLFCSCCFSFFSNFPL